MTTTLDQAIDELKAYMDAHDQLVEEYLEKHPDADWNEAYEKTADTAYDRMRENLADHADYLRMRAKEGK